jgi:hypothetical protein
MKKLIIATIVFVLPLLSHLAFAQRGGTPEERAEKQTAMMEEELKLTEDQLPKIKEINLKYAEKNTKLRDAYQDDREAMFTAYREVEKQKEEELSLVLTEEQMTLLQEKKEEIREARRGGSEKRERNKHPR